jgi:DNA-directed RNA polymerase specialized sigma24 family protein
MTDKRKQRIDPSGGSKEDHHSHTLKLLLLQKILENPGPLYKYLLMQLQNREEAFDAMQDTFVAACMLLGKFDINSPGFGTWIYSIARFQAMTRRKTMRKHQATSLDAPGFDLDISNMGAYATEESDEVAALYRTFVSSSHFSQQEQKVLLACADLIPPEVICVRFHITRRKFNAIRNKARARWEANGRSVVNDAN